MNNRALLAVTSAELRGVIRERDAIDHLYESTFLATVTRFESYLEELFYEVATGRSQIFRSGPSGALSATSSREDIEAMLTRGAERAYVQWLPIQSTEARALAVLRDGRPFSRLDRRTTERSLMKEVSIVRNAIAHRSGDAQARFEKLCPGALATERRTPAGFLQLATSGVSTYDRLCNGLGGIAQALSARSDKQAWKVLSPESDRLSGDRAPSGTYECRSCGTRSTQGDSAILGECSACHPGPCMTCGSTTKSRFVRLDT